MPVDSERKIKNQVSERSRDLSLKLWAVVVICFVVRGLKQAVK